MTDCACATMTTPLWTPHSGSESVRSSYSLTSVLSPLSSVRQPPSSSSSSSSSSAGDAARFVSMSEVVFPPSPPHPQPCPQRQVLRPSPLQQQQQHRKQEEQLQPREEVPMVDDAPQPALECDLPEARARTVAPQQQQQQQQRMRRPREEPTADAEAKAREPDETQTRRDSAPRLTREQRALLCREEGHAKAPPPPTPWLVRATRPLWQPLCATLRWVLAQVLGW